MSGHIKNTMRRVGNIERLVSTSVEQKNVQALAAAALLRHAGLQTVLGALKQYRVACSKGVVTISPKEIFNINLSEVGCSSRERLKQVCCVLERAHWLFW